MNGDQYTKGDFVDVVDEQGNDLPAVPKAWIGTDLLPAGVKRKGKEAKASGDGGQKPPAREPGQEPGGNASRDDWAAFAVEKGAKPEDLVDEQGKDLSRDDLKAKYATPKD